MREHDFSTAALMYASLPIVLASLILAIAFSRPSAMMSSMEIPEQPSASPFHPNNITFIALQDPDWKLLTKALQAYEREQHNLLQQLSRSLEVALQTEADYALKPVLSQRLQTRISTLAELLAQDLDLFQTKLLMPFEHVRVLVADAEDDSVSLAKMRRRRESSDKVILDDSSPHQLGYYTPVPKSSTTDTTSSSSYDSVAQVVAHLVRDWTDEGQAIRDNLYVWCVDQVQSHATRQSSAALSILVPGAGLGRLAYDLACQGHSVHAVELSLTMAAAAAFVFHSSNKSQLWLHPYLMDALTNEVDSQLRYTSVLLQKPDSLPPHASLSYSVANLLDLPLSDSDRYHVVVTCFFIDTATNVMDYIHKIHTALYPGGVWINVGPIQWHRNAQLFPSGDELHALIRSMGFDLTSWTVDAEPMEYRNRNEMITRSTHFDAYCPVRFVAVKRGGTDE